MTTPTDWRALCAELHQCLEYIDRTCDVPIPGTLLDRARVELAKPEPQGVTDEKLILKTYCDARRSYCYDGPEHENWQRDAERGATMAGLRAVLTRYATPPHNAMR